MLHAMWAYVRLLHMLALPPVRLPHSLHEPGWYAGCAAQQQLNFSSHVARCKTTHWLVLCR